MLTDKCNGPYPVRIIMQKNHNQSGNKGHLSLVAHKGKVFSGCESLPRFSSSPRGGKTSILMGKLQPCLILITAPAPPVLGRRLPLWPETPCHPGSGAWAPLSTSGHCRWCRGAHSHQFLPSHFVLPDTWSHCFVFTILISPLPVPHPLLFLLPKPHFYL